VLDKTKQELTQAKEDNERLASESLKIPLLEDQLEALQQSEDELNEKVHSLTMQLDKMRGHKGNNQTQTDLCMLQYSDQETQCDDLMLGPMSDVYANQAGNSLNKVGKNRIQSAINTAHSTHLPGANLQLLQGYQSGLLSEDQTIGTTYDQKSHQVITGVGPNMLPSLEQDIKGHTLGARPQTGKYPMNPMIITPGSLNSGVMPHDASQF
jgi:hypothetical protein